MLMAPAKALLVPDMDNDEAWLPRPRFNVPVPENGPLNATIRSPEYVNEMPSAIANPFGKAPPQPVVLEAYMFTFAFTAVTPVPMEPPPVNVIVQESTMVMPPLNGCEALISKPAGPRFTTDAEPAMPVALKVEEPFREDAPNDLAPKGPWLLRFCDPQLDALERQALGGSPTLAATSSR